MSKIKQRKKQHFVPKFYLRRFTHDGYRLFVFDKFARQSFQSNINDVASERYFYDFPEDSAYKLSINPQMIENILGDIEPRFSDTLDGIVQRIQGKTERIIRSRRRRVALSRFIALQAVRTKEFRLLQTETMERLLEEALSTVKSDHEYQVEIPKESMAARQAIAMFDPGFQKALANVLCNHIWLVGINKTVQSLFTSDQPVVKIPHMKDPLGIRSYSGFASEGIEIALPLTPDYLLVLLERTVYKDLVRQDGKSIPLNSENVKYYNSQQVAQSYRQVYCPSDTFDLAKEVCDKWPDLCTSDRTRILVD